MTSQAELITKFSERLNELVADKSRSKFARTVGIDRSTLSQLQQRRNRRLPRITTLVAIASATGVSTDWLLGLTDGDPGRTDIVPEEFALNINELSPLDESFINWYEAAAGAKVRTLPASLPDLLKTEVVTRYEVTRFATTRPEQKLGLSETVLAVARGPGSDIECCNSIQALEAFARGQEVWAALERHHRIDQLDQMIKLCEELYPTFRWFLYNARQRYAGAVTVFGLDRALVYLGQMYLVLNSRNHVRAFVEHFDDLIRAAVVLPPDVPQLLRQLRAEI